MLKKENGRPNIYFYITWFLIGIAGIPISVGVIYVILMAANQLLGDYIMVGGQRHITEDYLAGLLMIPLFGLITALLQFLVLRQVLPRMAWWIAATFAGFLAFLGVLSLAPRLFPQSQMNDPFLIAIGSALAGAGIGFFQWLVLRKKLPRSGWWILGVAFTWGLVFLLNGGVISGIWDILAVSVLPPLVTGLMLWLLFRYKDQPVADIPAASSPA